MSTPGAARPLLMRRLAGLALVAVTLVTTGCGYAPRD